MFLEKLSFLDKTAIGLNLLERQDNLTIMLLAELAQAFLVNKQSSILFLLKQIKN